MRQSHAAVFVPVAPCCTDVLLGQDAKQEYKDAIDKCKEKKKVSDGETGKVNPTHATTPFWHN